MDTKECIEFLKKTIYPKRGLDMVIIEEREYNEKINEVIKRLQMWGEFKKIYGNKYYNFSDSYNSINYQKTISSTMKEFEQKYFPKRVKMSLPDTKLKELENFINNSEFTPSENFVFHTILEILKEIKE